VLLSKGDLKMMINEVSGKLLDASPNYCTEGTVNLTTFLLIMENSAW
jgi:hypothetical protein